MGRLFPSPPLTDEIAFAVRYAKGKIIAVVGSNRKRTTSYLRGVVCDQDAV